MDIGESISRVWNKLGGAVKDVESAIPGQVDDKLFKTVGDVAGAATSLAPGVVLDAARLIPGVELKGGAWDHFSTKHTLANVGDLLVGEGTLTGYLIGGSSKLLDKAYRYGVEDNIEAPMYMLDGASSWGQAYALARKRTLGQTDLLMANQLQRSLQGSLGKLGGRSLATAALTAGIPGFGALIAHSTDNPSSADALTPGSKPWEDLRKQNSLAGLTSGTIDFGTMLWGDPTLAALKGVGAVNKARHATELARGEHWKALFGEAVPTGQHREVLDPVSGEVLSRIPEMTLKPGRVEKWNTVDEVSHALGLPTMHPEAGNFASMILKAKEIEDPAIKVRTYNALAKAAHGDADGFLELAALNRSDAYTLSNMARGLGSHAIEAAKEDSNNFIDILSGNRDWAMHSPEMVAGMQDELLAHPDFKTVWDWVGQGAAVKRESRLDKLATKAVERVTGSKVVGETPFQDTAAGRRAVARINKKGLGRDGSLNSGHEGFDQAFNDSWIAAPTRAFFTANPWTPAAQIVRGGFKEISWADLGRFAGQAALYSTGAAPAARILSRASNSLRSIRVYGSLNLEDANLSSAAVEHQMQIANVDPETAHKFVSGVMTAQSPSLRAQAVQRAQDHAIGVIADRYGVSPDLARTIARGGLNYTRGIKNVVSEQTYAAIQSSANPERLADGRPLFYGPAVVPDAEGALVVIPEGAILKSQEVNSMELMDLSRLEKVLKHDRYISALSRRVYQITPEGKYTNPLRRKFQEYGHESLYREQMAKDWAFAVGDQVERLNSLWKQSVLGLRLGAYVIRNTAEEQMRVWALGYTSAVREERIANSGRATDDGVMHKYYTTTGKVKEIPEDVQARVNTAQRAYDDTLNILDELRPFVEAHDEAILEYGRLGRHKTYGKDRQPMPQADPEVERYHREEQVLREQAVELKAARHYADEWRPYAGYTKKTIDGVEYTIPQAQTGEGGLVFRDLLNSSASGFDRAERDAHLARELERTHARLADQSPSLSIREGDKDKAYVDNYFAELSHIVNRQFNDPAAKVVIESMTEGSDAETVLADVRAWLDSDAAREYKRHNSVYRGDLDTWASSITDLVSNTIQTRRLAAMRNAGEVTPEQLREIFADYRTAPVIHRASGSLMFGAHGKVMQSLVSKMFTMVDRASLQRWTRHPMFSLYFNDALERRLGSWHDLVKATRGPEARVTGEEIESLAHQARQEALLNIKRTFYDSHSRSGAAHQLRFMFPFFAAHQDSVRFWGTALGDDPSVFRKLQIGFEAPRNMGVVVDQNGKPKGFSDAVDPMHDSIITPLPHFLGGQFQIPLSSAMLMLQQGSILNPGAGPMTAIPAAYFQKHLAAHDEEWDRALKFFNPYGAPKDEGALQAAATPLKRIQEAWDNTVGGQDSAQTVHLLNTRLIDAYVEYRNQHDGKIPSQTEWAKIAEKQSAMVRGGAMMRLLASVVSPGQPQPTSEYHALLAEYRRLADLGRKTGKGPAWATDEFITKYGETYYALTQSQSANRGHVAPTARALAVLNAYPSLRNKTSLDSWGLIVGPEGDGSFSTNAYRAMQEVSMKKGSPAKLSEAMTPEDLFQRIQVGEGWETYNKKLAKAMADSKDRGYLLADNDPQFKAFKKQTRERIALENPVWGDLRYQTRVPFGRLLRDAEIISADRSLSKDPGRSDIRYMRSYLAMRKQVEAILAEREKAGIKGGGTITSNANRDLLEAFNKRVAAMAQSNDGFREHVIPNLVYKDPFYDEDIAGAKVGDQ